MSPQQRRWRVGASLLARGNLCAAQQLLVKGLFKHDTRLQTVQVSCWLLYLSAQRALLSKKGSCAVLTGSVRNLCTALL